jgi:hypothetical protein
MRHSVLSILAIVASQIIAVAALTTVQASGALAADDCATKPNLSTTKGGHWYYHVDRVTNRKCWFLLQQSAESPAAAISAASQQGSSDSMPQSKSPSWLSSILGFAPAEESRETENQTVSHSADGDKASPIQQVARYASRKKQSPKLRARSSDRSADQEQPSTALNQSETDALFREFLLWQERQDTVDTALDATDRDALFREFLLWSERQGSDRLKDQ